MTKETKFTQKPFEVTQCPFCEKPTEMELHNKDRQVYVSCRACEATGPKAETQNDAVRLWNGSGITMENSKN